MRKRKLNLTDRYMAGVVIYGGVAVRRSDMFAHLQACGVTGPALLTYGNLPDVDEEPEERWDAKAGELVSCFAPTQADDWRTETAEYIRQANVA